jgi:anti-sigma factor RsiW
MTITRKVVLDLIPLYAANELSEDSRRIVEDFLKTDPDLAELVKKMTGNGLRGIPPASPSREAELRAFVQTKRIMLIRSIVWIFAAALLGALIFFFVGRFR